jgi:hypothetical protein
MGGSAEDEKRGISVTTPGAYNITVFQGTTFSRVFTWKDSDDAPIDLTGYTARLQVRASAQSEDVLLELTSEDDEITLGDEAGTITLTMDPDATDALDFDRAYYDLELESSGGQVTRLLQGAFRIADQVTRAGAS